MASTRNRNTLGNYRLEQRWNQHQFEWNTYTNGPYGHATDARMPGVGFTGGCQFPPNLMSDNPWEIESFLFGIGLTNLPEMDQAESLSKVQGNYPVLSPQLKVLEEAQVYQPPNTIYMPYPLSTPARPFFMR